MSVHSNVSSAEQVDMSGCLFVGDLHRCVTEQNLMDTFVPYGQILSVEVVRHRATGCSRGFGYVNFAHVSDANMAMDNLMFQELLGRPMRIMRYHADPTLRQTGIGNIYITGLAKDIDSLALYDTFSVFGEILSCKVATNRFGSKGYGFIHFKTIEAADKAIRTLDGMLLNDEKVSITHCKSHIERQVKQRAKKTEPKSFPPSLFVCNLPYHFSSQQLGELFSQFGTVVRATVMTHNGRSKGFGFVTLQNDEATSKALAATNGRLVGSRKLYVALSNSAEKRRERATCRKQQSTKCSEGCLFVGDLHPFVTEQNLMDTFVPYGQILSVEVVRHRATGCSRGFGFVKFANAADANMAMDNLMFQDLLGRPMRIMRYNADPTLRQTGIGNIYITGLAKDIDSLALYDTFSVFGEILSCKVATNRFGSKGYGFIHFKTIEAADKAIRTLDGMLLNDEKVSITHCKTHIKRQVEQRA